MSNVTIPYADPGRASFEVLDTYIQSFLLNGAQPPLQTARALPLPNNSNFAQFSVVGIDPTTGKVALATAGDDPGVAASGALTFSGTGTAADTITVGSQVYTLVAALSVPAVANEVKIGGSAAVTAANFMAAVNGDAAGSGSTYSSTTAPHASVEARANSSTIIGLVAKDTGTAGNAIATTETGSNTSFGASTLTGGLNATGVKAAYVLAHAASLGGSGSGNAQGWYSGNFNQDALVWHSSFDTDAKKQAAFDGAPTPTQILVGKRST